MKIIKELINVVTKYRMSSIDVLGPNTKHQDLPLVEFYEAIRNKEISTDQEAAARYFNSKENDYRYKKLKKVLKKQLINTTFFIDTSLPSFTEYHLAYYNCCKDWAAINILLGRAARRAAIELAERVLKQAIKYEFTIIVVDITKILKGHYGGFLRNKKKYNRYKNIFNQYQKIWLSEMEAEEFYIELVTNEITQKNSHEIANTYLQTLRPYTQQYQSYRLNLHYFLIELVMYTKLNNYQKMVDTCQAAIHFLEQKKNLFKESLALFYYQKTVCHIHLKEYEAGKEASNQHLKLTIKGTQLWIIQLELRLLLLFHTAKYDEAYSNFITMLQYNHVLKANIRNWKLYETYLYYLFNIEQVQLSSKKENQLSKFRVGKFLNNIPAYDPADRDTAIPTLAIQILFMIQKRKFEAAVIRIKAIRKYAATNLRKGENYRSDCFIKMLLEIPRAKFHHIAVARKTKKYLTKLQQTPLDSVSQQSNIEIIPYENLWTFLMASLDNSFHPAH